MSLGTVIYVGNFSLPDGGASANRVVSNGKLFEKAGYNVVFLGVSDDVTGEGVSCLIPERNMYEEKKPSGTKEWFRHLVSIDNIDFLVSKYPDTVMIVLYNLPWLFLKRIRRKYRIKVVYDCTEWTRETDGSLPKRVFKAVDYFFIRYLIRFSVDGLIVVSSKMKECYGKAKNVLLLPPLVDLSDDIWNQYDSGYVKDRFEFCFAGTLDNNKECLDYIVDEFSRLDKNRFALRIIGITEEEYLSKYSQNSLADNITFMGRLSHKETLYFVENCDCNLVVRKKDYRNDAGFPTKFTEAFTSGNAVIASDVSNIRQYAKLCEDEIIVLYNLDTGCLFKAMEDISSVSKKTDISRRNNFSLDNYSDLFSYWLKGILAGS